MAHTLEIRTESTLWVCSQCQVNDEQRSQETSAILSDEEDLAIGLNGLEDGKAVAASEVTGSWAREDGKRRGCLATEKELPGRNSFGWPLNESYEDESDRLAAGEGMRSTKKNGGSRVRESTLPSSQAYPLTGDTMAVQPVHSDRFRPDSTLATKLFLKNDRSRYRQLIIGFQWIKAIITFNCFDTFVRTLIRPKRFRHKRNLTKRRCCRLAVLGP